MLNNISQTIKIDGTALGNARGNFATYIIVVNNLKQWSASLVAIERYCWDIFLIVHSPTADLTYNLGVSLPYISPRRANFDVVSPRLVNSKLERLGGEAPWIVPAAPHKSRACNQELDFPGIQRSTSVYVKF